MNKFFIILFLIFSFFNFSFAENSSEYEDVKNYSKYNPDKNKYEFIKDYLISLKYLNINSQRREDARLILNKGGKYTEKEIEIIKNETRLIIQDNANLRIARNMIEKYRTPGNGFIIKASDLFIKLCNFQIELNSQEKNVYEEFYQLNSSGGMDDPLRKEFLKQLINLSFDRRESLRDLLEIALLIDKILMSENLDSEDKVYKLGITYSQRKRLLFKLDNFYGKGFEGKIRPGQTYVQASISKMRKILEDFKWLSLDESSK